MRSIPAAVTTAAQSSNKRPTISARLRRRTLSGHHRITPFAVPYSGTEAAGDADVVITASGAAITARTDTTTIYVRRNPTPATETSWSSWTSVITGAVSGTPVALATLGKVVALFYNSAANTISCRLSTDDGVTWSATNYGAGVTLGAAVQQLAADVRPGVAGELAGGVLLAIVGGPDVRAVAIGTGWQLAASSTGWGQSATALSGIDVAYQTDFEVIVTGSTATTENVWGLVFGTGVQAALGTWSTRWTIDESSAATTAFSKPTIATIDGGVWFGYEENRTTTVARRVYLMAHCPTIGKGGRWIDADVAEPLIAFTSGTTATNWRLAGSSTTALLVAGRFVRRSSYGETQTLSQADIPALTLTMTDTDEVLAIELAKTAPAITTALLQPGTELTLSHGYDGTTVDVATFELETYEITPTGRRITALGTGSALSRHRVRQGRVFNVATMTVLQLMNRVLARAGCPGAVMSGAGSTAMTTAQPAFALRPGEYSSAAFARLRAIVPELRRTIAGVTYLVNPTSADAAAYELGTAHELLDSRHGTRRPTTSRAAIASQAGADESFSASYSHLVADELIDERAASTSALLTAVADRFIRWGDMSAVTGKATIHPTPALEIADVITITDTRLGVTGPRRIRAIEIKREAPDVWTETLELSDV